MAHNVDLLHYLGMSEASTFRDLAAALAGWRQPDLFVQRPSAEIAAARSRFHRRLARRRRRESVATYLAEPWRAWIEEGSAAQVARRFLSRFPDRDLPDPDYDLLADRQAAAEYHLEEAAIEAQYPEDKR